MFIAVENSNEMWVMLELYDTETTMTYQLAYARDVNAVQDVVSTHVRHPLSRNSTVSYVGAPAIQFASRLPDLLTEKVKQDVEAFIGMMTEAMNTKLNNIKEQLDAE